MSSISQKWAVFVGLIAVLIGVGYLAYYLSYSLSAYTTYAMSGPSMIPTLSNGQEVRVEVSRSLVSRLQRGDIIVFKYPNNPNITFIKRIVGMPGDRIEISEEGIVINGVAQDDSYSYSSGLDSIPGLNNGELDSDEYFVMGDNRNNSSDSRAWGPVTSDLVVGRVVLE